MIPLVYNPQIVQYRFGKLHPLYQERWHDFIELLKEQSYMKRLQVIAPERATENDLLYVHSKEYIQCVHSIEGKGYLTADTPLPAGIYNAAKILIGHGLKAMELSMKGEPLVITFGGTHHAGRDYGGGFCIFNDVAIVAQKLIDLYGIKRIMILDTDAHHGNGTMDIFYESNKVLYMSIHQDPKTLYPGTGFTYEIGRGKGKGYTVNIPMNPHASDGQYMLALREIAEPLAHQFDPQVVIRNGGSDLHYLDELTNLGVTEKGLYEIGCFTRKISKSCNRLIDLTLSGYNRKILPYAWLSLISGICGFKMPRTPAFLSKSRSEGHVPLTEITLETTEKLKDELKDFWDFA